VTWPGGRRLVAAAAGALLVVGATSAALLVRGPAPAPKDRPELLLLSSLPIAFPEEFTLDAPRSPAMAALEDRYRVKPISVADSRSLAGGSLLLMAQPQAQPAEALVELDQWVRKGGRLLLLADPILEWPSGRPLGDAARPPMAFADTGLLGHWGLRLDAPDRLGPASFTVDGRTVHALSPGTLVRTGGDCNLRLDGFMADCRLGKGKATVIADADFIDVVRRSEPARSGNLQVLVAELARVGA
jgi:hypothetical protein